MNTRRTPPPPRSLDLDRAYETARKALFAMEIALVQAEQIERRIARARRRLTQ